jgi:hypothetical protein
MEENSTRIDPSMEVGFGDCGGYPVSLLEERKQGDGHVVFGLFKDVDTVEGFIPVESCRIEVRQVNLKVIRLSISGGIERVLRVFGEDRLDFDEITTAVRGRIARAIERRRINLTTVVSDMGEDTEAVIRQKLGR